LSAVVGLGGSVHTEHSRRWGARRRLSLRPIALAILLAIAVTASASGVTFYRVRGGDTLSAIAARYHTSVARLVALNHLPGNGNLIVAGSRLRVPGKAAHKRAPRRAAPVYRTVVSHYVVRRGDSLYAIAARWHVRPSVIAARNHLPRSLVVMLGQRLAIPHRVRVAPAAKKPAAGHPHQFAWGKVPRPDQVAAIIRVTAKRWGVDPRLALAVGWQESGFNQRWVSSTGAIGAMQVEPATGVFVAKYVVHRALTLYDARDNATAGVALLALFIRETHGNVRHAVAGYYQGLNSVLSRGMYNDTKRYVANVLALRNRFRR
jgi:soluble lytic murein transglycosylase-like protein